MAYGLCTQLTNELTGDQTRDYTDKPGLIATFTLAPVYAPAWMYDPVKLASFIDTMESRRDSQLMREFVISMPKELESDQQQALAKELIETLFVSRGMIGMAFLHDESKDMFKEKPNPHVHVLLTMCTLEKDGTFGKKCRQWNEHTNMLEWPSGCATSCRQASRVAQRGIISNLVHIACLLASNNRIKVGCCKRTDALRPPDPFRGRGHLLEHPLCLPVPPTARFWREKRERQPR